MLGNARQRRAPVLLMIAAIGVLSAAFPWLALTGSPLVPPAGAWCAGVSSAGGTWDYWISGTYVAAREAVQYPSTCDGDQFYAGQVEDSVTDGSCAYIDVYDDDPSYLATQGYSCTTYAWSGFGYSDGWYLPYCSGGFSHLYVWVDYYGSELVHGSQNCGY